MNTTLSSNAAATGGAAPGVLARWLVPEYLLAGLLVLAGIWAGFQSGHMQMLFTFAGIYLIAAMGLNVLSGYTGIISIAHGALVCVGAYATGILTVSHGVGFWPAAGVATLAGCAASVVLGLPALRLSSWYFVLITVAFTMLLPSLLVDWRDITGGYAGLIGVPSPKLPGLKAGPSLFIIVLVTAAAVFWLMANLSRSRIGWAFSALRDGTVGAEANGVSTAWLRLLAFAISGAVAGLAGAFYAAAKIVITPDEFGFEFSILFLFIVVLGGPARLTGPIFGVAAFYVLPEFLTVLSHYRLVAFGICLLLFSIFMPSGLAGALHEFSQRRRAAVTAPPKAAVNRHEADPVQGAGLEIRDIQKNFGGLRALRGVSLSVDPGSIHVIVGPNGSGKTTLLNVICGFYPANGGSFRVDGQERLGTQPAGFAALGVARTFQQPRLLAELSLLDNVRFGAFSRETATLPELMLTLPRARRESRQVLREARQLLELVGLDHLAHVPAAELTHGQQRLAEIARALMAHPRVILLDEPAAGLSMGELDRLGELLKEIRRLGITLVLVEHHVELVVDVADHVTVLDQGAVLASGSAGQVFSDPRVIAAYMGGAAA
ncbi:branched-chain amino acid ABC transporter ATP-binding protein/permease [Gemmobacter sp.]|uniref:branched-chain amino acid ABC transporter ATP-binding protein/permease n=1 Tax=Gemmobacter sp. TaxID=1898957 RepID=UPI002AFF2F99|nr:branched-chain amino acid ABC transporter ATP-binding protein/permease [Gemmobacter sp.]